MKSVLEGLLFVVGDEGLSIDEISSIIEKSKEETSLLLEELNHDYEDENRGIEIKKLGEKYKLTTKEKNRKYYQKLTEISDVRKLSQSALETLAIIAYNEPITRLEVDELRGVSSAQMIRSLIAKDFVKELGRKDVAGRPILYGITKEFLDYFGLSSKDELPKFEDVKKDDEVELYNSKYKEEQEEVL
ncbi:MAG: SMC-Scp complex subunit ScpB [bacterium]|nr:SMC-Scp complex subunit ScpB [bacterium]